MPAIPKTAAIVVDVISGVAVAAALMQWLPPIAAVAGIIWYAIQIWESKTAQAWWAGHNHRAQLRKLAIAEVNARLATEALARDATTASKQANKETP